MLSLQGNQSTTMTIFITPDHDTMYINHDDIQMLTEAEIAAAVDAIDEHDIYADLDGDDYADAVLADINS